MFELELRRGFTIIADEDGGQSALDWLSESVARGLPFIAIRKCVGRTCSIFIGALNDEQELAIRRVLDRFSVVGSWGSDRVFYGLARSLVIVNLAAALGEKFRDAQVDLVSTSGDIMGLLEKFELTGARE